MPLSASEPGGMQTQAMMQPLPDVTVTGTVPHASASGGYHHDELTGGGSDARRPGPAAMRSVTVTVTAAVLAPCHWQWQGRAAVRCWCICSGS
jgi:hypothetical protein